MDERLHAVPADDYDQVVRLAEFRQLHPEVTVRDLGRGGIWQAVVPLADAEITRTRLTLGGLLDCLDELGPSLGW